MNNNVLLWLLASNAAKETNEADYEADNITIVGLLVA